MADGSMGQSIDNTPSNSRHDDLPIVVYYETPNKDLHSCTIDEAHSWLREGYFTSEMLVSLAPKGVDIRSGAFRVWTLKELIERNGRAAPFLMCDEKGKMSQMEELNAMNEELEELKKRKAGMQSTIESLQKRTEVAQSEMLRIQLKMDSMSPSDECDDDEIDEGVGPISKFGSHAGATPMKRRSDSSLTSSGYSTRKDDQCTSSDVSHTSNSDHPRSTTVTGSDDWLKTPGIATRSIREIEAVPEDMRWRRAVVLGFRGTPTDKKIMENHARHMGYLRDRYREMKRREEDEKENFFPFFGTRSNFCDKSGVPLSAHYKYCN